MKKHWYDYLWILSLAYLILGFFNILSAWLGLLCFFIPLIISFSKGTKGYCNRYCGRGQLFNLLGGRFGLSRRRDIPGWMKSRIFRCGSPFPFSRSGSSGFPESGPAVFYSTDSIRGSCFEAPWSPTLPPVPYGNGTSDCIFQRNGDRRIYFSSYSSLWSLSLLK